MITVHHLQNSRSQRIIWLMEELGVDYDVQIHERDPDTRLAPASYKALHPLGKAPVVRVDGEALAETGAIIEYFVDRHPEKALKPEIGTPARDRYNYWMHAAEGSLMPLLVMSLFFTQMETSPPFFIRPFVKPVTGRVREMYLRPSLKNILEYVEMQLSQSDWFAGDTFTAADIMMSFPMEAAMVRANIGKPCPSCLEWLERVHARPGYKIAVEKGGEQTILT